MLFRSGTIKITGDGGSDVITFGLENSGVTAKTYASSTIVPVITVDSYGRVTAITNTSISFPAEADTLETVTGRGASSTRAITISNTTASTSTSTGALIVSGGVGVAKDLYANNVYGATAVYDSGNRVCRSASGTSPLTLSLSGAGALTGSVAAGTTSAAGILQLTDSTSSTSTTTAATPNSVKTAYDRASTAWNAANTAQTTAQSAYDVANTKFSSSGGSISGSISVTGSITATGDVTAYYSSDERLKENIKPIENALDKEIGRAHV